MKPRRSFFVLPSFVVIFLCLTGTVVLSAQPEVVQHRESLQVGAETRYYTVSHLKNMEAPKPCPLILAFHGYRGDVKTWFYEGAAFDSQISKTPFVIAYPEGPVGWSIKPEGRDLRFFDALVAEMKKTYSIDPARIYVIGHSNGAAFSSSLLLARAEVIAAAVAHSGIAPLGYLSSVPEAKRPLLVILGEKDPFASPESPFVQAQIARFRKLGFPVETILIPDWGHPWASPEHHIEEKVLAFLFAHPLPSPKK